MTKCHSMYTRSWCILWLVNLDRFCQLLTITDSDEICDMVAVRDLSVNDALFKSVISKKLKDFPQVTYLWKEQKDCIKIWSMEDAFVTFPTGYLSTLFTSKVTDEWKSRQHLHNHGHLCRFWGHNEKSISTCTVEQIGVAATSIDIWQRSCKELESGRLCVNMVHEIYAFAILFWVYWPIALQSSTISVICHVVMLYLGSFLLQNMFLSLKMLAFEGQRLKYSMNMFQNRNDN